MKLWLYYLTTFFVIILTRYLLVAGGTYWLFYASDQSFIKQSLNLKYPQKKLIQKDIALSITATVATAICAALVMTIYDFVATRLYSSI